MVKKHDNVIRLGFLANDLPFSGDDNGKLTGVIGTVMDNLADEFGVKIETQAFDDIQQMEHALKAGKIDLAGPVI